MGERLQKLMSQWGVASRRKAEQMILDGRVRLNGIVAELGQKADPTCDRVELDGIVINPEAPVEELYILLNKPAGVVSTCDDPQGRPTVLDLLPPSLTQNTGLHPVGRLDSDSTGALLLTNQGETTFVLTHPRHTITKCYHVWVQGIPNPATIRQWRRGVMLSGKMTLPAEVEILRCHRQRTLLKVVLKEGRNRQIRRVGEILDHPVISLHRLSIGSIGIGSLPEGKHRTLSPSEMKFLRMQVRRFAIPKGENSCSDSMCVRG